MISLYWNPILVSNDFRPAPPVPDFPDVTPPEFAATGLVASSADKSGEIRPTHAVYQARVALATKDMPILLRATGRAKIRVSSQTLGQRVLRYLQQTFRFEL